MNKQRLLKLAEVLDGVPPERLEMGTWGRTDEPCGFVGCIGGWATTVPEFIADGLTNKPSSRHGPPRIEILYREAWNFDALQDFFELNMGEAVELFLADDGPGTPKFMAGKIREMVSGAAASP